MRKLLLNVLLLLAMAIGAVAQNAEIQIGEGTTTNTYLPTYTMYNYSLTQQIYTADEIGMAGSINSLAIYNGGSEKTRTMDLYISMTDKTEFESATDWVEVESLNLVFSGEVTLTASAWTTFTFTTPFEYDGTSNLLVTFDDNTGSWSSGFSGYVFSAASQAIRYFNDNTNLDPTDSPSEAGSVLAVKNQIKLNITPSGNVCLVPTGLEVTNIGPNSATLSWTPGYNETAWQICLNNDEENLIDVTTNPYQLTGLTSETTYSVKVRTNCGDGSYTSWTSAVSFEPTAKIIIGTAASTNSYLPTYCYYNYSLTQQIYTVAEIGNQAGAILSVDFLANSALTRTLDVYMIATDKESFESTTDWITVTAADKVFSGSVTFAGGAWTTIELDNPFIYDGTQNVAVIVDDNTGSYNTGVPFIVFDATSQAIRVYSDGTNYDPAAPSSYTGTVQNVKNHIRLLIGEPPSCAKPTALAVSNITGHAATIAWTAGADETAWQVCLNDDEDNLIDVTEPSYTFTGLEPVSDYTVKVRANCGGSTSDWTNNVSFTTAVSCPAPELTLVAYTTTSATLTWTAGEAASWVLQYGTDNTFAENTEITVDAATAELTGLTSETVYYARVKAVCGVDDESDWSSTLSFEPTAKIIIGTAASTSSYLPTYCFYNYSFTQQIYTVAEIGNQTGYILSVDFLANSAVTRTLDVYMIATDKESFESATDWITATDEDKVFSGSVTFAAGAWTTIELDNPFTYDGTQNVVIIVDDNTGSYSSGVPFSVFDATSQAIRVYSDGTNYDPADPSSYSGSVQNVKNHIRLLIGEPPSCTKPTALAVSNITTTAATLTWTAGADETAWQICLGGDEENLIDVEGTPTYDLSGLTAATTYQVKVRANCGGSDGVSSWTSEVEFTTSFCEAENQCQISYELSDPGNYGYGWFGAELNVYDSETGILLATWALESGETSANGTLSVCNGRQITFEWISGAYDDMVAAYAVYDVAGDEIFSGQGTMADDVDYTVNCSACARPTNVHVSNVGPTSANLVWAAADGQTAWQVCFNNDEENIVDVTTTTYEITGLTAETDYTVKVRNNCGAEQSAWVVVDFTTTDNCPVPAELAATTTSTTANLSWAGFNDSYVVRYRTVTAVIDEGFENGIPETWTTIDADADGNNWLTLSEIPTTYTDYSQTPNWAHSGSDAASSPSYANGVGEFDSNHWLITPQIDLGGVLNFYVRSTDASYLDSYEVLLSTTGTSTEDFTVTLKTMASAPNEYDMVSVDLSDYADQQGYIAIHHVSSNMYFLVVDDFSMYTYGEWVEVNAADASAVLSNLTPETTYEFQVKGVCGDDETDWSESATFTTLPDGGVPTTYTITATAGENGTITPNGEVSVVEGEDQAFVIAPSENYEIDVLTVDSNEITLTDDQRAGYTYTFENVVAAHTINVTFRLATSVEINNAASMAVYPNPNNGMFSIDFSNIEGDATYELIDVRGAVVETREINVANGETMMFNHTLTAGTYFVRIINGDKVYVEQIVVE